MLLKNLMEKKQLDFNQPLLSVRRFSSVVPTTEGDNKRKTENAFSNVPPLPKYKSELKSGPIRNPGTVPFVWERSPGRSKYESRPQSVALEQPPVVPKLPPGRMLNVEKQALNKGTERTAVVHPESRNAFLGSHDVLILDKNVTKEERSRHEMEETSMSGSEDDDETYLDAPDTLSRSESFFLNCSISGVSGLDGPDMKPSGTFSTDPQTRDFMMGRFLPAAKAMASETPQHSTRKQPVAQEQPRQIKKMINVERLHQFNECRRSNMPHCSQCNGVEETEEEEDDDYDRADNSSFKVCGLFPRLCLQNSFCLLNPMPGMRKQVQVPNYPSHMTKVKSSYAASGNETVNEHNKDAVNKHKSIEALQAKGMPEDNKNELASKSNMIAYRNDYQKSDRSSLYKRLQGNGILPHCDKFSQSVAYEEKRFLGIPEKSRNSVAIGLNKNAKGGKYFRELLANERKEWELASASSMVEKTLYVDSIQVIKPKISDSGSSDAKGLIDCGRDGASTNKRIEETVVVDSSLRDIKQYHAASEKVNVQPESLDPIDSSSLLSSDRSMCDAQVIFIDGSRKDQDLMAITVTSASPKAGGNEKVDLESQLGKISSNLEGSDGLIQYPIKTTREKVPDNGKIELKSQICTESDQETPMGYYSLHPLPPPLPKSPSESWLKRALPAVSLKHTSLGSSPGRHVYPIVQTYKVQSPDSKWETIVKTSNVQHGHLRFSEELLAPIPEV